MAKTRVAVVKGSTNPNDQELDAHVRKAIEMAGGLKGIVKKGDTVIIKPNIVIPTTHDTAAVTDPRVCKTIADVVKEVGGNPVIGESSSIGISTEEAIQAAGYGKLREQGYTVLDFSQEPRVNVPIPRGKKMKEVSLPKVVVDAQVIIDVPIMKTHDQCEVTLALKNMKGILFDKGKRLLHHDYGIFDGVADLCTVKKPDFSVVDAILAMEGLGPATGDIVPMGLIIAGQDVVAVDTVATNIMGFETRENGCIAAAEAQGIGTGDLQQIEVVGESIDSVKRRFKRFVEAIGDLALPEDFRIIMDESACTGCRNTLMANLMDVSKAGELDKTSGWTMVLGEISELPEVDRTKLILMGVCTAKFRKEGAWVPGCPPNNRDLYHAMSKMGITAVSGVDVDSIA
jgi:uncharacterized protein (DUF362 family)